MVQGRAVSPQNKSDDDLATFDWLFNCQAYIEINPSKWGRGIKFCKACGMAFFWMLLIAVESWVNRRMVIRHDIQVEVTFEQWSAATTVQSTLGFETLDKAAALDLATATPLTDLCQ